jgi:hypothetical protein
MSEILVRFSRAGGRPPADDERIEVRADGSFAAHRTVGGARIGSFAGRLPERELGAMTDEVAACRGLAALWIETPRDGATETVELAEADEVAASLGSNARPPKPWAALVERLRDLLDGATAHPDAALELVADAGGARLVAAGPGSIEVDVATTEVRLVHLDATGVPAWRWGVATGDPATATHRWEPTAPGWSRELPFEAPPALAAGEWLQVWVFVTLRSPVVRRGRLFVAVPGGQAGRRGA